MKIAILLLLAVFAAFLGSSGQTMLPVQGRLALPMAGLVDAWDLGGTTTQPLTITGLKGGLLTLGAGGAAPTQTNAGLVFGSSSTLDGPNGFLSRSAPFTVMVYCSLPSGTGNFVPLSGRDPGHIQVNLGGSNGDVTVFVFSHAAPRQVAILRFAYFLPCFLPYCLPHAPTARHCAA